MKRAFLRKVKPVSCSSCIDSTPVEESEPSEQTPLGAKRKARTSAAMVGLALSMGATSLLVPRQTDGAIAAESKSPEASPSSVSHVATLPTEDSLELLPTPLSASGTIDYVVREGQTLQQIAQQYQVSVEKLAVVNKLAPTAAVKIGQVLKIPVDQPGAEKAGLAQSPQLLALADLSRLPASDSVSGEVQNQVRAERNQSLSRLEQQRNKLKDRLAELRRGESGLVANATATNGESAKPTKAEAKLETAELSRSLPVAPAPSENLIPTVAALPSPVASPTPDLDWMQVSQSLSLSSKTAATPSNQQAQIPVANSLSRPTELATRSVALPQTPTAPAAPLVDSTFAASTYQVHLGDTAAQIARAHNIPLSTLISANHLSDPNVIFVGQTLRMPGGQQPVQQANQASVPSIIPTSTASRPSQPTNVTLPVSQQENVDSEQIAVVPSSILPSPSLAPSSPNLEAAPTANRNSYVQNLLSEVKSLRGRQPQRSAAVAAQAPVAQPTMVAAITNPTGTAANLRTDTLSQPQAVTGPRIPQALRTSQPAEPTVVAAAPLGSENYAPLVQPVTGRMVSPDLPALPDADHFLPNGASKGYIWPARGVLTSGYGWRWGRMHRGIDIASDIGTPVHAAGSGVIEYAGWNSGGYGNMIEIRHADGSMTRYAHLNAIFVRQGQRINQSEQIGEMGSTGYSTGPHLHFEVHPNGGDAVNPIAYLPAQ